MFRDQLAQEFAPFGVLSAEQLDRLEAHFRLLTRWNEKLNLTRIRKLEDAVRFHYCESLFLGAKLPAGPLRVADIGSGPGFPGIPVAIYRPDLQVTLIESHQRKAVFLSEASRGLANVQVLSGRAEDCRQRFDWVMARAVVPSDVVSFGLSSNYALLMGEADLAGLPPSAGVEKIPWGSKRYVTMFHVEPHPDGT